ncbi:MAG: RNA 2'-phosphotransferase [Armatimonadota bacterium]|nr:RNA 2'-phosphotransferase [Armatimonadota bacterium]MDR5697338.1 RNA 2'-phosphotransferase [Armatimonadota bacterium]
MHNRHRAERLSRLLSLILRHRPETVGLALDRHGWVPLDALLEAVRTQRGWETVTAADLEAVLALPGRRRFELREGRVRARYGHSVDVEPPSEPVRPPEWLYHGTTRDRLAAVLKEGLRPQGRRFVHLSLTPAQALEAARRHGTEPVVLTIHARRAHDAGVRFYAGSPEVYLAEAVPPEFVRSDPRKPAVGAREATTAP